MESTHIKKYKELLNQLEQARLPQEKKQNRS
jgi:hypothetical protein